MLRALDAATPDGVLATFSIPARELFDRYTPDRGDQGALAAKIRNLLPAEPPEGPPAEPKLGAPEGSPRLADSFRLVDPLSKTEIRVLRYLPTNLSAPEIARELSLSVHTVRTHIRHLFVKLGVHGRTEAVARARALPARAIPIPPRVLRLTDHGSFATSSDNHDAAIYSVTPSPAPQSAAKAL
jgi:LuxR family maltose regulon positive regulatory protein